MVPITVKNLQLNSMGFLVPKECSYMAWSMISKAINNLINKTIWSDLDMFIDMPPGTGRYLLITIKKFP